jgi:DNA-binding transcriptional MerR regulator
MDKSPEAFRTISEVAEFLETPAHVLRFWETRFSQIKPVKRAGGRRYYRPSDVALLGGIRKLLHDDGMTIRGVQQILRDQGIKAVSGMALGVPDPGEEIGVSPATADEISAAVADDILAPPDNVVALTDWLPPVERAPLAPATTDDGPQVEPPGPAVEGTPPVENSVQSSFDFGWAVSDDDGTVVLLEDEAPSLAGPAGSAEAGIASLTDPTRDVPWLPTLVRALQAQEQDEKLHCLRALHLRIAALRARLSAHQTSRRG